MNEENISIKNAWGESLDGYAVTPSEKADKYPVAILVHGFGSGAHSDFLEGFAEQLAENGFLSFRFTFSGLGKSEGKYSDMTLSKEVSELNSIIEYVKNQSKVDSDNIFIFAHSFGTASTLVLNPDVRAIILASPSFKMADFFKSRFKNDFHPEGISTWVKPSTGALISIGSQFWPDIEKYDLNQSASIVTTPTMIIHGEEDKTILPEESESLFENLSGGKSRMLIKNADHKFKPNTEEAYNISINWLIKHRS